ncbi:MAG: hypothetical protein V3U92_14080 [Cellulophaga sp.]
MKPIAIIFIFVFSVSLFGQSPWTKKKGEVYAQLTYTTIADYKSLFGDPDYATERVLTDNTLQFYGEYGISDKTTLLLNLPIKMMRTGELTDTNSNTEFTTANSQTTLGNLELGIKHNFYNKKWLLTGQLSLEANTSSYDANSGIRSGYDTWTFTPLVSGGRGFKGVFVQAFVGANLRFKDYSSNFKVGGEVGVKLIKWIWLIGFVDIVKSMDNGNIILPTNNLLTGFYVNNQEYGAYGLKVIGEITESLGIVAGYGTAFFGNNVAKRKAANIGIYYKL